MLTETLENTLTGLKDIMTQNTCPLLPTVLVIPENIYLRASVKIAANRLQLVASNFTLKSTDIFAVNKLSTVDVK